jgi:hypothetical protein
LTSHCRNHRQQPKLTCLSSALLARSSQFSVYFSAHPDAPPIIAQVSVTHRSGLRERRPPQRDIFSARARKDHKLSSSDGRSRIAWLRNLAKLPGLFSLAHSPTQRRPEQTGEADFIDSWRGRSEVKTQSSIQRRP